MEENRSFWQRLWRRFRLSLVDEASLNEIWHTRISLMAFIIYATLMFVLTIVLISLLIVYTPVRNMLPGYSESIRRQLVEESLRIDSLGTDMEVQRQYLNMLRGVMAGEATTDTIQTLDSVQIIMREQLLEAKSQITEDFKAQYEEKERDNLQLFDVHETAPTVTFFAPVKGKNVTSVLDGTVIAIEREWQLTYTVMVQHSTYVSIYRHLTNVFKPLGTHVEAGENIGLVDKAENLQFELWQKGKSINPHDVIAY